MAITNGYCTLAELKARLDIDDSQSDKVLESIITAVSREIDGYCHRRFWKNSVSEDRYFTAEWGNLLRTADIVSVTGVAVDEEEDRTYSTVLTTSDYDLEPYNASLDGFPYRQLRINPSSSYAFSTALKGNKLTGVFGWPAVPSVVNEACLLQSSRLFKRKDAPFGVAGFGALGQVVAITTLDPDVKLLLSDPRIKIDEVVW